MIYVYLWIYVCLENQNPKNSFGFQGVYKEVLSVWVREGRDICEFAQHRFIYKSSDNIIHDYISILVNICMLTRGSNCECVQGQEHMWYMKCGVLTAVNFSASNSCE